MKKIIYTLIVLGLTNVVASSAMADDCSSVGKKIADEQGGQLSKVTLTKQNGNDLCVVVVIVPGRNGEQPRRVEVAVPAN